MIPPVEPRVKKGDSVVVNLSYLEGKPDSNVEPILIPWVLDAYSDSFYSEYTKCECFSFLFSFDMMMTAKWDGEKWIS
jgi:hypothetical protein